MPGTNFGVQTSTSTRGSSRGVARHLRTSSLGMLVHLRPKKGSRPAPKAGRFLGFDAAEEKSARQGVTVEEVMRRLKDLPHADSEDSAGH